MATSSGAPLPSPCFPRNLLSHFPWLKALESLLRCQICYDLFSEPTMTSKCAHNFCSVCVRKYLVYKSQCPQCYEETHENDLRPNRALADVLRITVEQILPCLAELVKERGHITVTPVNVATPATLSAAKLASMSLTTPTRSTQNKKPTPFSPPSLTPFVQKFSSPPPPSSSASPIMTANVATQKKVPCPVCSVDVPEKNIHSHLDKCLKDQEAASSSRTSTRPLGQPRNGMKPRPKIVYHLLTDSKVRKLLKEEGLDTKGDKKTLIARHQKFTVLWNAQCEAEKPMAQMAVIMQVKREEQAEKKEAVAATAAKSRLLDYDRKTDPEEMLSKKKDYIRENKSRFDQLIKDAAKSRKKVDIIAVDDDDDYDDFLENSPSILDMSGCSKLPAATTSAEKEPPKQSTSVSSFGQLYVTPKRKRLDLADDLSPKRLRQNGISSALQSAAASVASGIPKPNSWAACPVCQQSVAISLMSNHLDSVRCLKPKKEIKGDDLSEDWIAFFQSSNEDEVERARKDESVKMDESSDEKENEKEAVGTNESEPVSERTAAAEKSKTATRSKNKAGGKGGVAKNVKHKAASTRVSSRLKTRVLTPKDDDRISGDGGEDSDADFIIDEDY